MLATMHWRGAGAKPASQEMKSLQVQFYDTNELVQAQVTAKAGLLLLPIPVLSACLWPWYHRHSLCSDSSFPSLAPGSGP